MEPSIRYTGATMATYERLVAPTEGEKIKRAADGSLVVPDRPIVPFIEGDGIGPDDQKQVTYDFHRQMEGARKLSCSGFADAIIENLQTQS